METKKEAMGRYRLFNASVVLIALAASACSSEPASKAGGDEPPVELRIGTNDFPGRPAAEQIEMFAARVAELGDGGVHIEPVWRAAARNAPNWDQLVARQVISGELDMGNIPSRAWDTEGVMSLRALNAPFLITTDALLDEVVVGDLADEMLSGLSEVGVVGLALLPEGLRHPFGSSAPLLGPADYKGETLRAPASATTEALFNSLGATVDDGEFDESTHRGAESGYALSPWSFATGNVVFFPKVNALVINAAVFDRLSDQQRGVLEQAAAETLQWTIESRVSDEEQAAAFCEDGGTVVLADQATLAELEEATQPVYDDLEAEPQTKKLIAEIRMLQDGVPAAATAPVACGVGAHGQLTRGA
jgi:TRAP-type transport system periplasmic protein